MIENAHIYAYNDPDQLQACLDTLPAGLDVRVFDGRYCHFDGDRDTTPAFVAVCDGYDNVDLYRPTDMALPFGDPDLPPEWRSDVYEKTRWVWSHLPPDEWTLKIDTDERLRAFDASAADDWQPDIKYSPEIHGATDADGRIYISRLFKPQHWVPWINDCFMPRELFSREMDLETRYEIWSQKRYRMIRFINRDETDAVTIENVGYGERDREYVERRADHLERIGRDERAAEVQEQL